MPCKAYAAFHWDHMRTEEDKLILTSYVTSCYGSLTTLNLLFQEKNDQFVGQGGKDE